MIDTKLSKQHEAKQINVVNINIFNVTVQKSIPLNAMYFCYNDKSRFLCNSHIPITCKQAYNINCLHVNKCLETHNIPFQYTHLTDTIHIIYGLNHMSCRWIMLTCV